MVQLLPVELVPDGNSVAQDSPDAAMTLAALLFCSRTALALHAIAAATAVEFGFCATGSTVRFVGEADLGGFCNGMCVVACCAATPSDRTSCGCCPKDERNGEAQRLPCGVASNRMWLWFDVSDDRDGRSLSVPMRGAGYHMIGPFDCKPPLPKAPLAAVVAGTGVATLSDAPSCIRGEDAAPNTGSDPRPSEDTLAQDPTLDNGR